MLMWSLRGSDAFPRPVVSHSVFSKSKMYGRLCQAERELADGSGLAAQPARCSCGGQNLYSDCMRLAAQAQTNAVPRLGVQTGAQAHDVGPTKARMPRLPHN